MVVSFIAHTDLLEQLESRLAAARVEKVYEEKVADDETMISVRAKDLDEARYLGAVGYRAGALQIDIDQEAA